MKIGIIGYGEVGMIFSSELKDRVDSVSAWDIKFPNPAASQQQRIHGVLNRVRLCSSLQEMCGQADLIFSMVTASNTLVVADAAAKYLSEGATFVDLNSASPETKKSAAKLIRAARGIYVEAGVMTSVPPYGLRVPILLGGEQAEEVATILGALGMNAKVLSTEIGVASAVKMCRSVMIKGLEALVIESFTTARKYGVEDHMIATLYETFPSIDWEQQSAYFFSRVALHGARRAEEMREVARTVRESGFDSWMATAIAEKDGWMAQHKHAGTFEGIASGARWQVFADSLILESSARGDQHSSDQVSP